MYFNEHGKACKQYFPHHIHTPLHPDTMSDQVGQTDRKSTHNTESTLGLAAASNLQRLGFETSNEKKWLVINKNNYNNMITLSGFILLTDTQGQSATQLWP